MWVIGGILIYLAIKKDMEPALLLPMGFGAILVNLPLSPVIGDPSVNQEDHLGIITSLFKVGIEASEAMPLLLFIGIGCMIDFGPLLTNPKLFILGGARTRAQLPLARSFGDLRRNRAYHYRREDHVVCNQQVRGSEKTPRRRKRKRGKQFVKIFT